MSVASFEVVQESVKVLWVTYTTGQLPVLELGLVMYIVLGSATLLKFLCWVVCAALQSRSDSMVALAEVRGAAGPLFLGGGVQGVKLTSCTCTDAGLRTCHLCVVRACMKMHSSSCAVQLTAAVTRKVGPEDMLQLQFLPRPVWCFTCCCVAPLATCSASVQDHLNDIMSNTGAIVTAVAAGFVPNGFWIDPAGAIVISLYIVTRWLAIARQQVGQLHAHQLGL